MTLMQGDGTLVGRVANHRKQLARALHFTSLQQLLQQGRTQTLATLLRIDIHRIFQCPAIGFSLAKPVGVGKTGDLPIALGHQPSQAALRDPLQALQHLRHVRRLYLEGSGAVQNMMTINTGDGGSISLCCRANQGRLQEVHGRGCVQPSWFDIMSSLPGLPRASLPGNHQSKFGLGPDTSHRHSVNLRWTQRDAIARCKTLRAIPFAHHPDTSGIQAMVVIRLSRAGAKGRPFYHIVATDSRNRRDGRYLERLGFYNPVARGLDQPLHIEIERLNYWAGVGAQLSPTVERLVKQSKQSPAQATA